MLALTSSIRRALVSKGWSKRLLGRVRKSRTPNYEKYIFNLSDFESYRLVYVDESRCDKRIRFRRTG
jgi:hypothetical protein